MSQKFSEHLVKMTNPSGSGFDAWWDKVQALAKAAGKPLRADLKEWGDVRAQFASGKSPEEFVRWWTK